MLEPHRIAAIWIQEHGERGRFGSGYLLDAERVLTAGHVVERAANRRCEVRLFDSEHWVGASLVWCGTDVGLDAAVLRLDSPIGDIDPVLLGRFVSTTPSLCQAAGFPRAQAKRRREREVRDIEHLTGEVRPLTGRKSGTLTIHIDGSVPEPDRSGYSPWDGMSGAALFSKGLLTGIIIVDPEHFGTDRLEAVPVSLLAKQPGFRAALTGDPDTVMGLANVEARGWVTSTIGKIQTSTSMEVAALSPDCSKLGVWGRVAGEVFDLETMRSVSVMGFSGDKSLLKRIGTSIRRFTNPIRALKFSQDVTVLAVLTGADADLWNVHTGEKIQSLTFEGEGMDILISPDGRSVVIATAARLIWGMNGPVGTCGGGTFVWDMPPKQHSERPNLGEQHATLQIPSYSNALPFEDDGFALAFDGDGQTLAIDHGSRITIHETGTGAKLQAFNVSTYVSGALSQIFLVSYYVSQHGCIALSPDGTQLLTRELGAFFSMKNVRGGDVGLWDVGTGSRKLTIRKPSKRCGLTFSPDGSRFAVASDRSVQVFDTGSGELLHEDNPFGEPLLCCGFRPNGNLVTVTGSGRSAVVTKYVDRGL
jgi:WD40 repeat protein